jgi:prephenate dehydratase
MKVLAEGIETNKRNFTRFLLITDPWKVDEFVTDADKNKASLVFALPHSSGTLSKVLSVLSFYDMNLTKIQSLPIIGREWEYLFYINLTFADYLRYKQALDAIRPLTKDLKILGEYAEGRQSV